MKWDHEIKAVGLSDGFPRLSVSDLRGRDFVIIAQAMALLPMMQIAIRLGGWQRTAEWVSRYSNRTIRTVRPIVSVSEIVRIAKLIREACRRWPFRATCLDRSLVTFVLLRRRGVSVTLNIGFRNRNTQVEGHAWVEHCALPLAEIEETSAMPYQAYLTWSPKPTHSVK